MWRVVLLVAVVLALGPVAAGAHPGGTDADGGHRCRSNCDSWGYEYGDYHFHDDDGFRLTPGWLVVGGGAVALAVFGRRW